MACIPLLVINYSITEIFAKHSSNECHYGNLKSFISIQKKHLLSRKEKQDCNFFWTNFNMESFWKKGLIIFTSKTTEQLVESQKLYIKCPKVFFLYADKTL
jgi:hypothetical protein